MIRYSYNQQTTPPAPFVHVTLRPPERGIAVSDVLNDHRVLLDGPQLRLEIE
jgi:hypothetical protein